MELPNGCDSEFAGRISGDRTRLFPGGGRGSTENPDRRRRASATQNLTWYFNREGYEITVTHDGQEGLRKAQALLPDLILLDIMLPGIDGLTVLRELRAGTRRGRSRS